MTNKKFECNICLENKNNIYKVVCPNCNNSFCKECIKKWLLMEQVAYSCPNCKQQWDLIFIYKNMPLKFINEQLKQNYANILYKIHYSLNIQPLIDELHFIKYVNFNIIPILNIIYTINDKHLENIAQLIYTNFSKYTLKYLKSIDINMINERIVYNIFDIKIITQNDLNSLYNYYQNFDNSFYSIYNRHYDFFDFLKLLYNKKFNDYLNFDCLSLIFLIYNIYINNFENIINKYNYTKFVQMLNNFYILNNFKAKFTGLKGFYSIFKYKEKIDLLKYLHELCSYFNNLIHIYTINKLKYKSFKCFKNNCNGNLYHYNDQLICDRCNSIFCHKCYKEIFPRKTYYLSNNTIIEKTNEKYYKYSINQRRNHICSKEDLETVKLLLTNSKCCPKCGEVIFKDKGCDHMWCVKCHTMFNWSDLKITKTTTNPHYFAWLKSQGLTINDVMNNELNNEINENKNIKKDKTQPTKQLNYNECLNIIKKYAIDYDEKYKLTMFCNLLKMKMKPMNDTKILNNQLKYAYNLINEEEYKQNTTSCYISNFFIDHYNSILNNTIFRISDYFKQSNINKKFNLSIINEIIQTHNYSMKEFHKIHPSLKYETINENYQLVIN